MKKCLSPSDREVVAQLVEEYGFAATVKAAQKAAKSTGKKKRRPPNYKANLAAVYGYVEFHRKQKNLGGRKLSVDAACKRLWDSLDANTVTDLKALKPSVGRLRSMYYEAQTRARSDADLSECMRDYRAYFENGAGAAGSFPLLLMRTKDGGLKSPAIDTFGLGGAAVENNRPKIAR